MLFRSLQSCGEMSCVEPCPDCVTSGLRNSQPLPRGSQPLVLDPWCPLVRAFKCTGGSSHPPGQHSTHRTQAGGETFPFRGSGGQLCSAGPRQHAAPVHHSPSTAGHPWLSFPSSPASLSQDPRLSFPGWLDDITDSMDVSLSRLWKIVKDREVWNAAVRSEARLNSSHTLASRMPSSA